MPAEESQNISKAESHDHYAVANVQIFDRIQE
jgi:hypothetical protein